MKGKDLQTLSTLLAEYGMKPGVSTAVGDQKTGTQAKQTAVAKSVTAPSKSTTTAPSVSPTMAPASKKAEPEKQMGMAKDLKKGTLAVNADGDDLEIVDTVGNTSNPDTVVAKNKKGEFVVVEPDSELEIKESADDRFDRIAKRKNKLKRKIKRVLRAQKYKTQGEPVFEINFNNKSVAQSGLNAPIKCGFEAETTWPDIQGGGEDDADWLDDYMWRDISDMIYEQEGSNAVEAVEQAYREWLQESDYFYEAENEVINDLVNDRKEDEAYIDDFVSDRVDDTDVENYKDNYLDGMSDEELEEFESWDDAAWARQYVEEEMQDNFEEWLADQIRDNGEQWDDAWDRAQEAVDMDEWVRVEHGGSWNDVLSQNDIYLYNQDAGGGRDEIASRIEDWASNNSRSNDVRAGDYHSGSGIDNTYWRVEDDSSIEGDGTGAEIISPVYDSPAEMLKEMKSLFEFLESEGVETNSSTGLHVTMSIGGDAGKTNPLKMALLLGDKYLLKQFDREFNSYAKSQQENIKKQLQRLNLKPSEITSDEIAVIEKLLQRGIDFGKFSSINFKDAENSDGNKLIEFRIGGGNDYHEKFDTVAKSTIRYAVTMLAGHDEEAFKKDYIKAMFRLINQEQSVSADTQQKAQQMVDPESMDDKVLSAFQTIASEKHYTDSIEALSNAYMQLADVKKMRAADPQGELDLGEDEEAESQDWRRAMITAQKYFVRAFAMLASDVASGANRAPAKAAQVAALRGAMKDFGLTADILWSELQQSEFVKRFPGDHHNKLEKMAKAVNSLLKKQDAKAPEAAYAITIPRKHVIVIPTEKHRALFGDIFGSDKKDDTATISQQDFKVIDELEIDKVKWARYEIETNERFIEREQEIVDSFAEAVKTEQDPDKKADLTHSLKTRQAKIDQWDAENAQYKQTVDAFVKKHGFAPKSTRTNSESIGTPYSFVNDDERKDLSQRFNIKFDVKESKMSAFDKFDKLPLAEQLNIISKVDKKKLDEAWSNKQKATVINEEWYDAYRDFKGMGYSDAQARAEANRMFPQPQQSPSRPARSSQKPELRHYMFYNVPAEREQDALNMGVKKLKSGKFAIPVYNTSGRSTQTKINNADAEFGTATKWSPKKKNETIEAEQDMAALLTAYGTPKKKKKKSAKVKEGAVPVHNVKRDYAEIMNKPLLGSDIKAQMQAYFVVPDPSMVREFRAQIAMAGKNVDLRPVFKGFADRQLHPKEKAQVSESILTESRGVTARQPGEQYISDTDPKDILTIQSIDVFPNDGTPAYDSVEDLQSVLDQAVPDNGVRIDDNNPTGGSKAAIIATVTNEKGEEQYWIRFIKAIPAAGVDNLWKTLRGYKYSKGASRESIPVKPSDMVTPNAYVSTEQIATDVNNNATKMFADTEHAALVDVLNESVTKARANDISPIKGAAPYFNVLQKYAGEYLGPLALIDGGNQNGDTPQMLRAYGLKSLKGSTIMFPDDTAYELVDSIIKTPDGKQIGVSSKAHTGGGATSSLSGVVKQLTPEIEQRYPRGTAIMKVLGTTPTKLGPVLAAKALGMLTDQDVEDFKQVPQGSRDLNDIKNAKLREIAANQGVQDENHPNYRVFFRLLAGIVNQIIPAINADPEFIDAMKETLNNNNFIQLLQKGKTVGDDVTMDYYTKYPAVFEGAPKLVNKGYAATMAKDRLGFKLKK